MSISLTERVTISPDVMFRTVGDEGVALNLKTELYLGLDAVGTRMWDVLTRSGSIQEALDALVSEYDVPTDQLRLDLEVFIGQLIEQGLIEVKSGEPQQAE